MTPERNFGEPAPEFDVLSPEEIELLEKVVHDPERTGEHSKETKDDSNK